MNELLANRFQPIRLLGEGGMGRVLLVRDLSSQAVAALKLLHPRLCADPTQRTRFFREAYAAHSLRSEHIVRVFEVGALPDGTPFMLMEFLKGQSLGQLLDARGPLPVAEAVGYVAQACAGLSEAHSLGIVHRDLKPGNLLLSWRSDGRPLVKIVDFGIAHAAAVGAALTSFQQVLGSPHYMAPEQMDGGGVDLQASADVWALGVVLYRLLEGALPFEGDTLGDLLVAMATQSPRPMARPDLPPELRLLIERCLQLDPSARPRDAGALRLALEPLTPAWSALAPGEETVSCSPAAPIGVTSLRGAELAVAGGRIKRLARWKLVLGATGGLGGLAVAVVAALLAALIFVGLSEAWPMLENGGQEASIKVANPAQTTMLELLPQIEGAVGKWAPGARVISFAASLAPSGYIDTTRAPSSLVMVDRAGGVMFANLVGSRLSARRSRLSPNLSGLAALPLPHTVRCSVHDAAQLAFRSGIQRDAFPGVSAHLDATTGHLKWEISQGSRALSIDATTCARLP